MAKLRIPRPSGGNLGRTKNLIHFTQALIIFVAWAMTIAIWTKGDGIDGRTVWYWILVSDSPGSSTSSLAADSPGLHSVGSVSPPWFTWLPFPCGPGPVVSETFTPSPLSI